jgi:cbb3-type cytochrome oxidase subunit 3
MRLSDIMANAGLSGYAEIALILFLLAFVAIVIRIFWPGRDREMDTASRLPFDEDHPQTRHTGDRA